MRRAVFVFILTAVTGLLPVASFGQPVAQQPTWTVGDTWTYRYPDGTQETVTVREVASDHYVVEDQVGSNLNMVQVGFDFSPHVFARFQWPLQAKKQWSFNTEGPASNNEGGINSFTTTSTVEAYESVTVPAGTFEAFRVKGTQCNHTQQDRCGDFLVWYAPKVKSFVKISWVTAEYWGAPESSAELLSYQIH